MGPPHEETIHWSESVAGSNFNTVEKGVFTGKSTMQLHYTLCCNVKIQYSKI